MYSEEAVGIFLEKQGQLFDEPVADTLGEAGELLEECMSVEVNALKEVRRYLEEAGADVDAMSDMELKEAAEVFPLPSGRYLIVEG